MRIFPIILALIFALFLSGCKKVMHEAVNTGDVAKLQELISSGKNIEARDRFGKTPLHETVTAGLTYPGSRPAVPAAIRKECAKLLLAAGADIDAGNENGRTPLHFAVGWGDSEMTSFLINHGASINAQDHSGRTPLHGASRRLDTAKMLLDAGAEINFRDSLGETPLFDAVLIGAKDAVKLLLEHGADPHIKNETGKTAFDYAGRECLQLLNEFQEERSDAGEAKEETK